MYKLKKGMKVMGKYYYWYKVEFWEDGSVLERTGLMCEEGFAGVAERITSYYGEDCLESLEIKTLCEGLEFNEELSFEDTQKLFVIQIIRCYEANSEKTDEVIS